jgi:phosphopantetheine adenylyltransferase
MGGVAKHLSHLHEDRDLTFNKLKKILAAASSGEIEGTEKTDGFNIYLGIKASPLGGNRGAWFPAWARNKGDMKIGGRSFAELAAREFAGGDEIKKTYLGAFQSFEAALKNMPQEELTAVFGENKEIFYNTEIQGPSAKNVINYDEDIISIHRLGHKFYDSKTNSLVVADTTLNSKYLDKAIDKFEEASASLPFAVRRTAFLELNKLEDDHALNIALAEIQKAGLSGNMTIEDFLENYLLGVSNRVLNFLSPDIQQDIVNRILKKEGFKRIDSIYRGFPPEVIDKITDFVNTATASYLSDAIWPIELAIHNFAVELLKGLKSAYILDSEKELSNFKNEVESAIRTIQSYQGEHKDEVHDILAKQLLKLKHHDNITTVVEGFVFQVDDQMYKFTGNFAPINQLLGLFKFGRGKIPPLEPGKRDDVPKQPMYEEDEDPYDYREDMEQLEREEYYKELEAEEKPKVVTLFPGAFKPPHAGHFAAAKHYADNPNVDEVRVIISKNERAAHEMDEDGVVLPHGDRLIVTPEMSLKIWEYYAAGSSKIRAYITSKNTPVKDAYDEIDNLNAGDTVMLVMGQKDANCGDDRFGAVSKFAEERGVAYDCDPVTEKQTGIDTDLSATHMRQDVLSGNRERFYQQLPKHIRNDSEKREEIFNLLQRGVQKKNNESISSLADIRRLVQEVLTEKAPPGREDQVKHLKGKVDSPYAVAWASYNKSKKKKIEEEEIEEVSTSGGIGGGSIEGYAGPGRRDGKKKKKNSIVREEDEQYVKEVLDYILSRGTINANRS